jgi:hypothetical protein
MDEIKVLRTKQINDFMSQFDDLNNVDVDVLEEGLKNILKETPGIDFEYGVDFKLNEATGEDERLNTLKKINILYTYIDEDVNKPKIGKISYVVG